LKVIDIFLYIIAYCTGNSDTCGLCDHAEFLIESDDHNTKELGFRLNKKQKFVSLITVINDLTYPENNGKTFIFQYGSQIAKMLLCDMNNDYHEINEASDNAELVFEKGAPFIIKCDDHHGFPTYIDSSVDRNTDLRRPDDLTSEFDPQMLIDDIAVMADDDQAEFIIRHLISNGLKDIARMMLRMLK
jgi:hypothetical protein